MHPRSAMRMLFGVAIAIVAVLSANAVSQTPEDPFIRLALGGDPESGQFLVDGNGFTLYGNSSMASGQESCVGDCERAWQPVLVTDIIGFGPGVNLNLIGTSEHSESTAQVTYNDIPLFRFVDDLEPGQFNGQGIDEQWSLVSPAGELFEVATEAVDGEPTEASVSSEVMETGQRVFANVCSSCHGASGNGGLGPRFVGNERLTDTQRIAKMVINGSGYMPPVGRQMSNEDLAAVFTFVRNSWGNDFGPVTPEEVKAAR